MTIDLHQSSAPALAAIVEEVSLSEQDQKEMQAWIDKRQARFTANCQACKGTGKVDHRVLDSELVIPFACPACSDKKNQLTRVAQQYWKNVPSEYRFCTLGDLQPSPKSSLSVERQQAVIDLIKAEPGSGYAFFGPPGIGKTVWTTALYGRALWQNLYADQVQGYKYFPVWRITTKAMLDEHTAYATANFESELDRKLSQPRVTSQKIANVRMRQGQVPRLFLEEIDKVRETESRRNNLFEILDALQANGGQLVINSNLTPEEFAEKFGADLWWRIKKMAKVMSLF